jgi:type VI secretion system (T6SS) spike protein VgrG3
VGKSSPNSLQISGTAQTDNHSSQVPLMLQRVLFNSIVTMLILSRSVLAVSGESTANATAPRQWKVEIQKNGKWVGSAVFDTRQQAQEKLNGLRAKQSKKAGPLVGRVVPTDWSRWEHLGALSAKYESGNRKSGTVSSGKGDPGGISYGSYQLASKVGTAQRFADQYYPEWFHGTKPGSDEFSALWKKLAAEREPELAAYEHLFIADTHYQPFADRLRRELHFDVDAHSNALRDVAWSTAVQHGAGNKIFQQALEKAIEENRVNQLSDAEIISLIYEERGRVNPDGKSVYFSRSSPKVQESVRKRFKNEQQDALKELAAESASQSSR